jgi:tetratricopeptide (TPR) repeat protein
MELRESRIETSVASGAGSGGNVALTPARYLVLDRSEVRANADLGFGGNIDVGARDLFRSTQSAIDASSRLGIDGTVRTASPVVDLSADLVALPKAFVEADRLLAQRCEERGDRPGSFQVHKAGLPDSPQRVPSLPLLSPAVAAGGAAEAAPAELVRAQALVAAGAHRSALAEIEIAPASGAENRRVSALRLGLRARAHRELGERERAREEIEEALAALDATEPARAPLALDLAGLLAAEGNWGEAEDAYQRAADGSARADARAAAAAGRALAALRRGDSAAAAARLEEALAALQDLRPSRERRYLRLHTARLFHAIARIDHAAEHALRVSTRRSSPRRVRRTMRRPKPSGSVSSHSSTRRRGAAPRRSRSRAAR